MNVFGLYKGGLCSTLGPFDAQLCLSEEVEGKICRGNQRWAERGTNDRISLCLSLSLSISISPSVLLFISHPLVKLHHTLKQQHMHRHTNIQKVCAQLLMTVKAEETSAMTSSHWVQCERPDETRLKDNSSLLKLYFIKPT